MVRRVRILLPYGSNGSGCENSGMVMDQGKLEPHTLMLLQFGLDGVVFVCVGIGLLRVSSQSGYSFDRSLCTLGGGDPVVGLIRERLVLRRGVWV